eukprot:629379-Prymnesium_polylepis.1
MGWPHSDRRKIDPTRFRGPPTGPRDRQRGCRPMHACSQVASNAVRADARGAACCSTASRCPRRR